MKKISLSLSLSLVISMALTAIAQSGPPTLEMTCGTSGVAAVAESSSGSNSLPICTNPHTVRYIRVAFHYLLKENNFNWSFHDDCTPPYGTLNYSGPGNFTETSDGDQNAVYNGFLRAEEVVAAATLDAGDYQLDKPVGALPSGVYSVVVLYNGQSYSKNAVKP